MKCQAAWFEREGGKVNWEEDMASKMYKVEQMLKAQQDKVKGE